MLPETSAPERSVSNSQQNPDTAPEGAPAAESGPEQVASKATGPYQNLWVPLIVIPAGIVISIVVVVSLFGLISGSERSIAENLERVIHGGTNERSQALFNIARQVNENLVAIQDGEEQPWPMEEGFESRARQALERMDDEDYFAQLTLNQVLAVLGEERATERLVELLGLDDQQDPDGKVRFMAALNLGAQGVEAAREPLLALLQAEDEGLRGVAAVALAGIGGDGVEEALIGALSDQSLMVRGNAAMALGQLRPDSREAVDVLFELLDMSTYEAENQRDSAKYSRARDVSEHRTKAAEVLAEMQVPGIRERLEALADDEDLGLREVVLVAIQRMESGADSSDS